MYPQLEVYRDAVSMTRNQTYHLDLPKQGRLSFIMLEISGTHNGAPFQTDTTAKWRVHDFIDEINVVANGQRDIIALNGKVAQAMGWWDQGVTMPDVWRQYSSASLKSWFVLNFGPKMWDPNFYLQLEDFDSIELQIKNSMTSTYWGADPDVSVYLGWLRGGDVPASQGFLKKEIWRRYTTVQGGREYMDLPTALPIRRILIQAIPDLDSSGVAETGPENVAHTIKLTFQSGLVTVFDGGFVELMKLNYLDLGHEVITQGAVYHNADYGFDVDIADVRGHAGVSGSRDGSGSATIPTIEGDRDDFTQKMETYEGDSPFEFIFRGWGYQNIAGWRFDFLPFPQGLLDPSEAGEGIVELEIGTRDAASAADGTVRVILDRLATPDTL